MKENNDEKTENEVDLRQLLEPPNLETAMTMATEPLAEMATATIRVWQCLVAQPPPLGWLVLSNWNLHPMAASTVVVKGRRGVAAAATIHASYGIRRDKGGGAGVTFQKLELTFTLMGQAQNGLKTQVFGRKAEEAWMSLAFNSLD